MDWKLELVVVPVSDVDRAKAFYTEQAGFQVDVDRQISPDFRVVQVTPPGSACSITLMRNTEAPGSLQGLHLVVSDIEAARDELVERGTDASEISTSSRGANGRGRTRNAATTGRSSPSAILTGTAGWSKRSATPTLGCEPALLDVVAPPLG